ncbi:MAG: heavy metal-associated domain-containing protein [Clostridia bacterium]|nr:heavy metal-associated domain-containing protein [Clostridia bacterium]
MGRIENGFVRYCLKPAVSCNLPGRLRMTFRSYKLLPKEALPYLHYIRDVLTMLPGVTDVQINPRIGTVLVLYDPETTASRQILRWVDIVVDTGLELAGEMDWQHMAADEADLERMVRSRLILRLPQAKEG